MNDNINLRLEQIVNGDTSEFDGSEEDDDFNIIIVPASKNMFPPKLSENTG